jgi:type IV pilus assembly protein PilW
MRALRAAAPRRSRGYSLVEVMVAAAVGLILLLALTQVFLSNRRGQRVLDGVAAMHEGARFALERTAQVIRLAGYQGNSGPTWLLGPMSATNGGVVPVAGTEDATNGSDALLVAFGSASDAWEQDCQGNAVAAGTTVWNRFSLTAGGELVCAVSVNNGTTWTAAVALADGVEAFHVLYGEDTDADGAANRYVSAGNVGNMDNVASVRIALLMATADDTLATQTDTRAYAVLNETVHGGGAPANDRRMRRVVSTTVNLRNNG